MSNGPRSPKQLSFLPNILLSLQLVVWHDSLDICVYSALDYEVDISTADHN